MRPLFLSQFSFRLTSKFAERHRGQLGASLQHDVLLALMHISRHAVVHSAGNLNAAKLFAGQLVHEEQHGRTVARSARVHEHGLRYRHRRIASSTSRRDIHVLQIRVIEYTIRRLANRDLPQVLAGIHVDRRDLAVRWLEHWQVIRAANLIRTERCPVRERGTRRCFDIWIAFLAFYNDSGRTGFVRGNIKNAGFRISNRWPVDIRAATIAWTPVGCAIALVVVTM